MLVQEALSGPTGKVIRDQLLQLIGRLDDATLLAARDDKKSHDDVRYRCGIADGVRMALTTIVDLGKSKS